MVRTKKWCTRYSFYIIKEQNVINSDVIHVSVHQWIITKPNQKACIIQLLIYFLANYLSLTGEYSNEEESCKVVHSLDK